MTDQDADFNRFNEPEAIDELMDRVADQLQSQMRAANQKLRTRAARLLSPRRAGPGEQPPDVEAEVDAEAEDEIDAEPDA